MRRLFGAAAAAVCALGAAGATARTVFDIPVSGNIQQTVGNACGGGYDPGCIFNYGFFATLELALPSGADGEYQQAGMTMTLLGVEGIEGMPHGPIGITDDGVNGQIDVLVQGGHVVDFTGTGDVDTGYGGRLQADAGPGHNGVAYSIQTQEGPFSLSGQMDLAAGSGPIVAVVPEPGGTALVLAGLALLAMVARRSRRGAG
jgi:hypothetical protein